MKTKIILLSIILLSQIGRINAQETPKTYHEKMKILMSELDSTKFKNNILYDKVYPLANLKEFNQNGRKDTSNYKHFTQAVHELHLANNKREIMDSDLLEQLAFHAKNHNQVQVGIINMDMTTIKEDAFDENDKKIEIDSTGQTKKMIEVVDKDPYKHIQSLVVSPLPKKVEIINGEQVTFNFVRAFIQKSTNPIKELYVDFGDGQLQPIIENRSFTNTILDYNFNSSGYKVLKFTGNYQDDTDFETFAMINIAIITPINGVQTLRATESFTPYIPDYPSNWNYTPTNEFAKIEYKVFHSTNPPRDSIMKPIIIVDGIDYDDERDCNYLYEEQLKLRDTGEQLGFKLRQEGYDVIIANFPTYKVGTREEIVVIGWDENGHIEDIEIVDVPRYGGADYIQRNAKAVKELIRKINDKLIDHNSTEEIIVVGPSMGGLVTRWALKEMEDAGENPNVGIWVSFDAPHQGANASIGLQFGASYKNDWASLDKLKRKASRQMLVYHYLDEVNNTVDAGAPGFRNRFKNELNSLSYPQNLRKVALVNGSSTGEINNNPNGEFIHTDISVVGYGIKWGEDYFFPSYIRFTNNYGTQNVFELDYPIMMNVNYGKEDIFKKVTNNSQIGSYDNAPGCIYTLSSELISELEEVESYDEGVWIGGFHVNIYPHVLVDNFSFMPTKSTLDFQGSNQLLRDPICYNLVESGETPFDSYYAPEHNEPHVQLNTANVTWLLNELASPTPTAPPIYCTEPVELTLAGPPLFCPNEGTATYTLSPNDLTGVQWTLSGELENLGSNDQQIIVKWTDGIPNWMAFGEITASVTSNTVTKEVSCVNYNPQYQMVYNENTNVIISLENIPNSVPLENQGITDVQWELTSGNSTILSATETHAELLESAFTGKVTVTNDNGSTTKNFFWPYPNTCYALVKIGTDRYQVIDRCNDNEILSALPIKELYDIYGNKINDIPINYQDLDISNIGNSGQVHIIHIDVNGENLSKIIVKD